MNGGNTILKNCKNQGKIYSSTGGLIGSQAGNLNGNITIKDKCENKGIIDKFEKDKSGQLFASISNVKEISAGNINVSKDTIILQNPIDTNSESIELKKLKDSYLLTGNDSSNLITLIV